MEADIIVGETRCYPEEQIAEIIKNAKEKEIVLPATYWERLHSHCEKGGNDLERQNDTSFNAICEAFEKSPFEEIIFVKAKEFANEYECEDDRKPRIRFRKNSRGLTEMAPML